MFLRSVRAGSLVGAVLGLAAVAVADVTILGKPQLGSFTALQAAVDAADHGDVLLVESGTYSAGFTIDNKALTVLALVTGGPVVNGYCEVKNLGGKRNAALIGLKINGPDWNWPTQTALLLTGNAGHVRVQSCTMTGGRYVSSFGDQRIGNGATLTSSGRVVFTQCTLTGRDAGFNSGFAPAAGGDGLDATDSAIALYDCVLKGGRGSDETYPSGGEGGAACRVEGFGVFASGCTMTGGKGGGGDYIGCTSAGDGGDALHVVEAQAQLLDNALTPGLGNGFYTCYPGADGVAISNDGGVVNTYAGQRRKLSGPTQANDGSLVSLTFTGQPGDAVWVIRAAKSSFQFLQAYTGVATVPVPWLSKLAPLGTIGAGGTLVVQYPIADLSAPLGGWIFYLQGLCVGAAGTPVLASPLQLLVYDV